MILTLPLTQSQLDRIQESCLWQARPEVRRVVSMAAPCPHARTIDVPPRTTAEGISHVEVKGKPGRSLLPPLQQVTVGWSKTSKEWTTGWHAREWNEGAFHSNWPRFRNVSIDSKNSDVVLKLSADAEAGLQYGEHIGTSFATEMDFTVQNMRSGVIAAPLWTYDQKSGDEIDFEIVGLNGLQLTVHSAGKTLPKSIIPKGYEGDLSGRRIRVGITARLPDFISFYVDGQEVLRVDAANAPGGRMISTSQQILSTIWAYPNGAGWAGAYVPPSAGQEVLLRLHGFAYQAF